ncbi:hypothetical protein BH09SUM1_BH09SUM1_34010 [soil metagenome]
MLFTFILAALFATGAMAQPATTETGAQILARAKQANEEGNFAAAWRALVELQTAEPAQIPANLPFVGEVSKRLFDQAKTQAEGANADKALLTARDLLQPDSLRLVEQAFPKNVESLKDSLRVIQGLSYWKLGQQSSFRGQRERADSNYRKSLEYIREGDAQYPRVLFDFASSLRDSAMDAEKQGKRKDAEWFYNGAAATFDQAQKFAGADAALQKQAKDNLAVIARTGFVDVAKLSGVATPTPTPTPTPVPGFLDKFFGPGGNERVLGKIKGVFVDPKVRTPILQWIGIVAGVIIVLWVGPIWLLGRIAHRGNIEAAELIPKARWMGIAVFIPLLLGRFKGRGAMPADRKKNACPHCDYGLDDPFAYEDMVFSRCPKCKGQVTPIFTLEGLITFLAGSLSSEVERVNTGLGSMDKFVERESMVRLVRAVITLAVRRRASDLHVEPDENHLIVRQRIDGLMTELVSLPRSLANAVVSAIKVQANLNIAERRVPQDGKMQMHIDKTDIDIRVASSPAANGEKVSMRLLDIRSVQVETRHLGMAPASQELFTKVIHAPHGLILVAGPTGSGKTTTLYVALQAIKTTNRNIISIEDPVEFRIPGVNQIQVNPVAGLTFATGLRSILRQDPDVIMVGEIRDHETAEISVNAATTGHLVFSTLHTIDSASSVARLVDLGVGTRQFADALSLVMAQRLIRLVCQHCSENYEPGTEALTELGMTRSHGMVFRRGKGCTICNNTGYFRRTGVFEMLEPSDRLRGAIENEKLSTSEIRNLAIQSGMKTLRQESIELLLQGLTTVEETIRVTK